MGSTAERDRPAPWNPRSGFEGEGAIQGDVSRPKQSGGRVTATDGAARTLPTASWIVCFLSDRFSETEDSLTAEVE